MESNHKRPQTPRGRVRSDQGESHRAGCVHGAVGVIPPRTSISKPRSHSNPVIPSGPQRLKSPRGLPSLTSPETSGEDGSYVRVASAQGADWPNQSGQDFAVMPGSAPRNPGPGENVQVMSPRSPARGTGTEAQSADEDHDMFTIFQMCMVIHGKWVCVEAGRGCGHV